MGLEQILILIIVVVALLNALAERRNRRRRSAPPEPPVEVRDAAPSVSPKAEVRRALSGGPRAAPKPALTTPAAVPRPAPPLTLADARRGIVLLTIFGPCLANTKDDRGANTL
ncbi:MAG: hypothetical protein HY900_22100 [Deltaproteobacteria bacterium]|nr:hypothetical protein [Deltaproteobacteria bacterium]